MRQMLIEIIREGSVVHRKVWVDGCVFTEIENMCDEEHAEGIMSDEFQHNTLHRHKNPSAKISQRELESYADYIVPRRSNPGLSRIKSLDGVASR